MSFSCPICSERLDRPAGGTKEDQGDINISSTPCGHIMHTYCIQRWLTGNLASSKQCPCCRKVVPGARVLPLFPTTGGDSFLDDSIEGEGTSTSGGGGAAAASVRPCDHSHFNSQINKLKGLVEDSRERERELNDLVQVLRDASEDFRKKYEQEKIRSDNYMFQWKQSESYKSYAEQQERIRQDIETKLEQYQSIELKIKNVEEDVKQDFKLYSSTPDSLKKLLETHHVILSEYNTTVKKLEDSQFTQERSRQDAAKFRKMYTNLQAEHAELQRVHNKCMMNTSRDMFEDSPLAHTSSSSAVFKAMHESTPLRPGISASIPRVSNHGPLDDEVTIMKPFSFKKKATKGSVQMKRKTSAVDMEEETSGSGPRSRTKSAKLLTEASVKRRNQKSVDEEEDLPLRGNLPGIRIEMSKSSGKRNVR